MNGIKNANAQQVEAVYNYKNIKKNLHKTYAATRFNNM
jgi:hypothetical protein